MELWPGQFLLLEVTVETTFFVDMKIQKCIEVGNRYPAWRAAEIRTPRSTRFGAMRPPSANASSFRPKRSSILAPRRRNKFALCARNDLPSQPSDGNDQGRGDPFRCEKGVQRMGVKREPTADVRQKMNEDRQEQVRAGAQV